MRRLKILPLSLLLLTGCGGASARGSSDPGDETSGPAYEDVDVQMSRRNVAAQSVIVRADLTVAVNERRYRPEAPPQTEFEPTVPIIYLVGKLRRVPTHARIEARWFRDVDPRPMLISNIRGSQTYDFIASFSPSGDEFVPGSYTVRIFVDELEIGGRAFTILGADPSESGQNIKSIAISQKVDRKMRPKNPKKRFKRGTRKLIAGFDAINISPGSVATVRWVRASQVFHEEDIHMDGDRRYSAQITGGDGLPPGKYQLEILVNDEFMAGTTFTVGSAGAGSGPSIDAVALGLTLNDNNMPKRSMRVFKRDTPVIQCGLRFLDLPQDSVIEVQWYQIEDDGESQVYVNRSHLAQGGSGTMGAAWEPSYELSPGDYKVCVVVNDETLTEETFEIR